MAADPWRPGRGPAPALATRRGWGALRTFRPGRQSRREQGAPSLPAARAGREGAASTKSTAPGSGEVRTRERCKARRRSREPPSPPSPSWPTRSRSRRTAAEEMRPAGAQPATGRGPARGSSRTEAADPDPPRLNPPGGLRGPHPFTSQRFHALLNSLFKVLFNFPLRNLSTIGLEPVFSPRWSLPPALGCIPKQPDTEKTGPRRDGGRYRPHTVHGLSLDQKDSGPRATPGKRSSVRHISHARPSDGDSALGSSLFARRY